MDDAQAERDAVYEHLRWLAGRLKDGSPNSYSGKLRTASNTVVRKALYDAATDIRNGAHRKRKAASVESGDG